MDKAQAIQNFWAGFGLTAYEASTVPTGESAPSFPYITYDVKTDSFESVLSMSGSLWYRSSSWEDISKKTEEIAQVITEHGYYIQKIDNGYMYLTKGAPFAQRMSDPSDDMIRRMYININVEFLTAY